MQRTMKALALAAGAALLLTACQAGGGGQQSASPSTNPDEKVELQFQSLAYQPGTVAAVEEIVNAWNAANPNTHVVLSQASWDGVHDQLVTQFQGKNAPDVIHNEAGDMTGFAQQGYLADLGPYLSEDLKTGVRAEWWDALTFDGSVFAAPIMMQSYVVFANTKAFADAGVEIPTGDSLSWEELATISKALTKDGKYGLGWGLAAPFAPFTNLALGFGGTFLDVAPDGSATVNIGDPEVAVAKAVHSMAYDDKSIKPTTLTLSGGDTLPGFLAGEFGMYIGGTFLAAQIAESAPDGFEWTVLPPLAGSEGALQAATPQTLSVSIDSQHVDRATEFINFFLSGENAAKLALGDLLVPASTQGQEALAALTTGQPGWEGIAASGATLVPAPFTNAANLTQWKDQYGQPAFKSYLANEIDIEELKTQLTDGWNQIR